MTNSNHSSAAITAAGLDFSRTEYLLNPSILEGIKITAVGLGSGGAPACDHLVMAGVRSWDLYDPDILEPVNLVKHPRMRTDLEPIPVGRLRAM